MPLPAVYDVLANGQVDAIDTNAELIWKLKYYEHADTVVASNHLMFSLVGLVSARIWKDLSEDDCAAFKTLMPEQLKGVINTYLAQDP